jgi:ribosomal protein L15
MDASAPERLQLATEVAALKAEEKRVRLATAMYDKLAESLDRLGADALANSQESRLINVLAEKAQLLSGGATSRDEVDVADRGARLAAVHQLKDQAAKRAAPEAG